MAISIRVYVIICKVQSINCKCNCNCNWNATDNGKICGYVAYA